MTKNKIIRAELDEIIVELIAEKGYVACSMSDIAARASIAKSSVYHYAATKEQLIIDALKSYYFGIQDKRNYPAGVPSFFVVALVQCVLGAPPEVSRLAYDMLLDNFSKPSSIDLISFLAGCMKREFGGSSST